MARTLNQLRKTTPRRCPRCGQIKPVDQFYLQNGFPHGRCKPCTSEYSASRRQQQRDRVLSKVYGIDPDRYWSLWVQQTGRCASCGLPERRKNRQLSVDHDHSCCPGPYSCGKCIRGLLCDSCNGGIARLGDDYASVCKAARYLKRYEMNKVQTEGKNSGC